MTDEIDEAILFARMRSLDDTEKFSYAEKGRICLSVMRSMIHMQRIDPETGDPCSFTSWVHLAAPWSYQTCFAAMNDIEELKDVPIEHLAQIPKVNLGTMKKLSTKVRNDPKVLEAAKTQRSDEFIDHINRDHPDQHLAKPKLLRFMVDESEYTIIEEVLKDVMENGAISRTQAMVSLCVDYWIGKQKKEMRK